MMTESAAAVSDLTHDLWYDGSVRLWQPKRGLRATTDSVLLAAAIPANAKIKNLIELGAGCGAATLALAVRLALATRINNVKITAAEKDSGLAELLARNIRDAGFESRIEAIRADIFDPDVSRTWQGQFDCAFCNPPFNDAASSLSPAPMRRAAMVGDDLGAWIAVAMAALRVRGRLVLISRSDRLGEILKALPANGAGSIAVKPVHSHADAPAIRVLVAARRMTEGQKQGKPLTLLPPLVMRQGDGLTPAMHAISHARGGIDLTGDGLTPALEKSAPSR